MASIIAFAHHNPFRCKESRWAFLSNFYPSPFNVGQNRFVSNEQYYMWRKAIFFKDFAMADKILNLTENLILKKTKFMSSTEFDQFGKLMSKIKQLGRKVKDFRNGGLKGGGAPFDQTEWDTYARVAMADGLMFKFIQNPELKALLASTGKAILAEAAPWDPKWGIGVSVWHADAIEPKKWKGTNWLGECLMSVRGKL